MIPGITIDGSRRDALVIEARSYVPARSRVKLALPYRPHHHRGGFAIYRPKFIVETIDGHDLVRMGEAFSRGVSAHENGATIWQACADQTW